MKDQPLSTHSPTACQEKTFNGRVQSWEVLFLIIFAATMLWSVAWQSSKVYLNNDELVTAVVVSNPSLSGMLSVIRHGGELNPPLFFILEWLVARTAGTGDLALRAISGLAMVLTGWVLFFTVRLLTGPRVAAVAVSLMLGLSREVFGFASTARYYSLLLMLVSLAVFLALRLNGEQRARRRDCLIVFLTHFALVYLHLYGGLYSGLILMAMLANDWLRRIARWRLYFSVGAAWLTFAAWLPSLRQQLHSVAGGVYVPPNMLNLGFFLGQLDLGTPLALVLLFVVALGTLSLVSSRPSPMAEEVNACSAPAHWSAAMLLALALMAVPIGTWMASHVLHPPPYMLRYAFPISAAWVLFFAFILAGVHRFPRVASAPKAILPLCASTAAWLAILAFCLFYQPLRARKNAPRPAAPFVDEDYGHKDLPVVFENSWYYLQRAWYGRGREYVMLIDHAAAEADPGWYTKNMEREFKAFSPRADKMVVLDYAHLPDWPNGFLAVDDDFCKTFEWVFAHHPELKVKLLGSRLSDPDIFGEQRVYLVQKVAQ